MTSSRATHPGRLSRALLRRSLCALALLAAAGCGDGGTGSKDNPTPTLSSLDPGKLLQWSDTVRITVTGAGFVDGAVVRMDGTAKLTTFVSPSQVTAAVPAALMQAAGSVQVTVVNPAPGGGESAPLALPVEHRVPDLLHLEPAGAMHGDAAFTLSVHGAGFTQASVVRWNGADRPTTFVEPGRVTAQIPASDVAAAGTAQVTVFSPAPGGGTSNPRVFTVAARPNPVPVAGALAPNAAVVGTGASFTLTGSGFMAGSQVWIGGFTPTTTFVSPTELHFSLQANSLANSGFAQVHVVNPAPGGGQSNPVQLRIDNPAPTLSTLSPSTAPIGGDSLVVRVTGTGFVAGTTATLNGLAVTTRRLSATELDVVLGASRLAAAATYTLRARNPQPGGGDSNPLTLSLVNPAPVLQSASPAQADAGQDSLVVRLTGSGFLPTTVGRFEGAARTTRYVSATALDVVLTAADVDEPGTFSLTAFTAAPGGGTSAAATLTLAVPVPVLDGLPSYGASAGRPGFDLVVHGSGFVPASVVRWNGTARDTRYLSGTRLETTLSSADLAQPGTAAITVHTPGGGTSATRQLTIRAVGAASLTGLRVLDLPAEDVAYDAARDRLYASVTAGPHANTVVRINPNTGEIDGTVGVGSSPGRLALSSDGTTLWVGVDGARQVRSVALPAFTAGTAFSTGFAPATELHAVPGQPLSVAVVRGGAVTVYDNGVARPRDGGSNTVAFGASAAALYGYNNSSSEFGLRTFRVDAEGVTELRVDFLIYGYYQRILFAAHRVYGSGGDVVDVGARALVGSFEAGVNPSSFAVDAQLGRAYFVHSDGGELTVFDVNTFQELGRVFVSSMYNEHPAHASERLVRWGTDGLALNDGENIYIFRTPLAGP